MLNKIIRVVFLCSCVISIHEGFGQTSNKKAGAAVLLTADSLTSGNYKDILSSFYQLAVKNLTGPNKELHFTSNPFAIMLRNDPSLAENSKYLKPINQFWRRVNFDLDARLDSAYKFNGFAIGVKYELLNRRNISMNKAIAKLVEDDPNDKQFHDLLIKVSQFIHTSSSLNAITKNGLITELSAAINDSTVSFNKLSNLLQGIIKKVATDNGFTFLQDALGQNPNIILFLERNKGFRQIVNSFQNKPLWTIGMNDTSYSNGNLFKSVNLSSEFLKGIMRPSGFINVELDFKTSLNFTDDSLLPGKNLQRQVFNFEPGLNIVLKGRKNNKSYLELKLSGSYNNVWKGHQYKDEKQITNTINATIRFRVFDEIWIPLEFKYDRQNHNVFGFLNITANFKALGQAFKK